MILVDSFPAFSKTINATVHTNLITRCRAFQKLISSQNIKKITLISQGYFFKEYSNIYVFEETLSILD